MEAARLTGSILSENRETDAGALGGKLLGRPERVDLGGVKWTREETSTFLSTYYVPMYPSPKLHHLGTQVLLLISLCDYAHFADEEIKVQRLSDLHKARQLGFKPRPLMTPKSISVLPPHYLGLPLMQGLPITPPPLLFSPKPHGGSLGK